MSEETPIPARLARLCEVLADRPGGLSRADLAAELQQRFGIPPARVPALVAEAGNLVRIEGDRITLVAQPTTPAEQQAAGAQPTRPLRAIAFDLECATKVVGTSPYVERAIFQIGACRFGRDRAWVNQTGPFSMYVKLPTGFSPTAAHRAAHASSAKPPAEMLSQFAGFVEGTDVIVAYNGTGVDFPAIDEACERNGVPLFEAFDRVDAYYLSLACWPLAATHQLGDLATQLGIAVPVSHDALADTQTLIAVIDAAATAATAWPEGMKHLVSAVGAKSPAWRLIVDLAGITRSNPVDSNEVEAVLRAALSRHRPVRPAGQPAAIAVPPSWRDARGRLRPHHLARAIRPSSSARNPQEEMADVIADAFADRVDLAVEAPTGTGKSLAVLAAALDWLDADPAHRVVITTHTKALQAQLARDIERLAGQLPGLLDHTSLVKGAANRLSLQALVGALADASAAAADSKRRRGIVSEPAFAELGLYLMLRLVESPVSLLQTLESGSVDTDDVPAFFDDYTQHRWHTYLSRLSQADAGDYRTGATLGPRTWLAHEHMGAYRLIIANHALVFAHLEDLARNGTDTLVVFDEAHALESAATDALAAEVTSAQIEFAASILLRFAAAVDPNGPLASMAHDLESVLDAERIGKAASAALDRLAGSGQAQLRSAAVASLYTGDNGNRPSHQLLRELGRAYRLCRGAARSARGLEAAHGAQWPSRVRDQYFTLVARLDAIVGALDVVLRDVDDLWGTQYRTPPAWSPTAAGSTPAGSGNGAPSGDDAQQLNSDDATDDLDVDVDADTRSPDDDTSADDATAPLPDDGSDPNSAVPTAPPPGANRVVYLTELPGSQLAYGHRYYRIAVRSAPIRLPAEPTFAMLRQRFARSVLTSATLTVAGNWSYLDDRLGLEGVRHVVIRGGFDYARQARLVCLADFPSWAEQSDGAVRTVAWQLVGYAREALAAGRVPGGVVLTTSTASAAAIAEQLGVTQAREGIDVSLSAAPLFGNRRATQWYETAGGWLVGTKGLWTGIDIADPARTRVLWINKLPFPPFADPLIATRRAEVEARAEANGIPDAEAFANEHYYLPLGALELRQGVGRLIRSVNHRGIIVISDRKLAGATALRRLYRRVFLGSLDPGLLRASPGGSPGDDNVMPSVDAWTDIWSFLAAGCDIDPARIGHLTSPDALLTQSLLPETRAIRALELTGAEEAAAAANGTLSDIVLDRAARIGAHLKFAPTPLQLSNEQHDAIAAAAIGNDVLALLPTGAGKSFCFQLPALAQPGVTLVVSPLIALMVDQALELNRTIGGAVRALVAPLRESSSRAGRQEVAEQLTGVADHGIKLIYCSPERLAQGPFRSWIEAGVRAGAIRRIVFDEAHCLVQWGDDFRPSYRRLVNWLTQLRSVAPDGQLALSAFTATANVTVREGLRTLLFGLPAHGGPSSDPPKMTTVAAEPIRPELAVYRRMLRATQVTRARLLESVFDVLEGHTIIYCLTVRDVDSVYAHLRDYAGPGQMHRIRRFHGRLAEAEKGAVLADFREAPREGDEGFAPMVVIATSAFGLGIDRPDVRCVFVAAPPTDLAALYQQLGRAGRDSSRAGTVPGADDTPNIGIALGSEAGFRLVEFMTRDTAPQLLDAAARSVLRSGQVLDAAAVGERLLGADVTAGRLPPGALRSKRLAEQYRTIVVRAAAILADVGALDDLGDLPATIRIVSGEAPPDPANPFAIELTTLVASDPAAAGRTDVITLHGHLQGRGLAPEPDNVAATWAAILDLHHEGVLDVSQAPNRRWLSAQCVLHPSVPDQFGAAVKARSDRAARELIALRAWFADGGRCANEGMADYFNGTPGASVPAETCSTEQCRCLDCLARRPASGRLTVYDAFLHPRRQTAAADDHAARQRRIDGALTRLLWDNRGGVGAPWLRLCLRGDDTYYDTTASRRRPLPSRLLYHRLFGAMPGIRERAVNDSVARLVTAGTAVLENGRYRHTRHVAADAARQQRSGVAP